jgi:peptidoglycan/xylan/chitin deacetylase (PgdA/CDA1 family)
VIIDLLVALTFDIEKDCCPLLNTTIGVEEGLPKILKLLERYRIECTFFVTGEVAELFPNAVRQIAGRHEVSSHGYWHEKFDKMTIYKRERIEQSKKLLEKITNQKVIGFRAPRFLVSKELYEVLEETRFKYDSSLTCFKLQHFMVRTSFPEFRVQLPSALLNFPTGLQAFKTICRLSSFPVIFFHCWEAVDIRSLLNSADVSSALMKRYLRPDMWINTGEVFLERLAILLGYLLDSGFHFTTLRDAVAHPANHLDKRLF